MIGEQMIDARTRVSPSGPRSLAPGACPERSRRVPVSLLFCSLFPCSLGPLFHVFLTTNHYALTTAFLTTDHCSLTTGFPVFLTTNHYPLITALHPLPPTPRGVPLFRPSVPKSLSPEVPVFTPPPHAADPTPPYAETHPPYPETHPPICVL
jgi:hypothetical protein